MSAVRRSACDRCHGQKMRCLRGMSQTKCNRCQSASTECVYSLARKAGRPATLSRNKNQKTPLPQPSPPCSRSSDDVSGDLSIFGSPILGNEASSRFAAGVAFSSPPVATLTVPCDLLSSTDALGMWEENYHYLDLGGFEHEHEHEHEEERPSVVQSHTTREGEIPSNRSNAEAGWPPPHTDAMQQLSRLSGKLFAQISESEMSPHPGAVEDLQTDESKIAKLQKLTAHVIESSIAFHDILSNMVSTLDPQGAHTATSFPLDTATTLQILTAYIRLAQLHHALYTNIHLVLSPSFHPSCSSPSAPYPAYSQSIPVVFSSLGIGGTSLAHYPRFQLKFILQICVDHLGKIEALLGLPAGSTVSENQCASSSGLLDRDTRGVTLLVRSIMIDAEETVKAIRKVLAELIEEFRGSIQI